eukprot:3953293-Pleurochrysis_carterae.AAC.1
MPRLRWHGLQRSAVPSLVSMQWPTRSREWGQGGRSRKADSQKTLTKRTREEFPWHEGGGRECEGEGERDAQWRSGRLWGEGKGEGKGSRRGSERNE